jgi:hypothetical protein
MDHIRFGLVFSLLNQFKLKLFQLSFFLGFFTGHIFMGFYFHLVSAFFWVFSLIIFLRDSIFILFLFSQLRDSFLNRLACMISGNSTLIFFLLDHCQKIKLCKKVHKTKERKEIIWLEKKKQGEDQKIFIIEM